MKKYFGITLIVLSLLLTGCASVPMASSDLDTKAKTFNPSPDKASLYIYRNENFGGAIPMSVDVNGRILGDTAAKTYFHLDLLPGKYEIQSHSENTSLLEVNAEAGNNYFIWQEIKMGVWMARSSLQLVDEAKGKEGVKESKLIKTSVSGKDIPILGTASDVQEALTPSDSLRELDKLHKDGIVTDDEYKIKKKQILDKM